MAGERAMHEGEPAVNIRSAVISLGVVSFMGLSSAALAQDGPQGGAETNGEAEEKENDVEQAAKSPPQIPTFRGGTLGIPTPLGVKFAQVAAAVELAESTEPESGSVDFNYFARVGGLNFFDRVFVDIVAERHVQTLPHVPLGMQPALPRMVDTDVTSAGFRTRIQLGGRSFEIVSYKDAKQGGLENISPTEAAAKQLFKGTSGNGLSFGFRLLHLDLPRLDTKRIAGMAGEFIFQRASDRVQTTPTRECTSQQPDNRTSELQTKQTALEDQLAKQESVLRAKEQEIQGLAAADTATAEAARGLRDAEAWRIQETQEALQQVREELARVKVVGAKADTICEGIARRYSFFASISATHLASQTASGSEMRTALPEFTEWRLSVGAELQAGKQLFALLPRMGAYATLSRATWQNDFVTNDEQEPDIIAWQTELGFYFSGHFSGGFSGLLSFGVQLPYGHDVEPQGFINIVPSIGTLL